VDNSLNDLLAIVESDSLWWLNVAQQCEELADQLPPVAKAKCSLLCAVLRERAKLHQDLVAKARQRIDSGFTAAS
jgi:hypothetical protein